MPAGRAAQRTRELAEDEAEAHGADDPQAQQPIRPAELLPHACDMRSAAS